MTRVAVCKLCEMPSEMPKGARYCAVCAPIGGKSVLQCPGCGRLSLGYKGLVGYCQDCAPDYRRKGAAAANAAAGTEDRTCRHCGDAFTPTIPVQAFCSPACNNRHWCRRKQSARRAAFVEDVPLDYIFRRDGGRCQICKRAVDRALAHPDPLSASIDHIVPVSRGGEHSKRNCQLAHFACNASKGAAGIGFQQLLIG